MPANYAQQFSNDVKPSNVRRVLIPIDNTAQSSRAFEWYLKDAKQLTDQVIFANVIKPMPANSLLGLRIPAGPVLMGTQLKIDRQTLSDAKTLCRDYVRRAETFGIRARGLVYVDSQPSVKLARLIEAHGADMVVLHNQERRKSLTDKNLLKQSNVSMVVPPVQF